MNQYKICVYAICKNEQKFAARWMESVQEADRVVVTDTGSTDGTAETLRGLGADVYRETIVPWRFDKARNIALSHVPEDTDICVSVDLDETFEPGWRRVLEASWRPEHTRARYPYIWNRERDGEAAVRYIREKIHRRHGYRWVRPVHEELVCEGTENAVFIPGLVLNHTPDPSKPRGQYLPLLELSVEERPDDDRVVFWLGREYLYAKQYEKCIQTLSGYLLMPNAVWNEERSAAMRFIAACHERKNDFSTAKGWLFRAIAECPQAREPFLQMARLGYRLNEWPLVLFVVAEALKITGKTGSYLSEPETRGYALYDYGAIACFRMGLHERALEYARQACGLAPDDKRLQNNLRLIEASQKQPSGDKKAPSARLVHTLLFYIGRDYRDSHLRMADACLKSLEKSTYKTVVVFNQGDMDNDRLKKYLSRYSLDFEIIGEGKNTGVVEGRQRCFETVWERFPETRYVSELHLDMVFTAGWEDPLVEYLEQNDEPAVCAGMLDKNGVVNFLPHAPVSIPTDPAGLDNVLRSLRCGQVVHGFTHPCIHKTAILREVGGYNTVFLKGKQCFGDDSLLLAYYYYYGTRADWHPKVNYNSVVYHALAGQRLTVSDNIMVNFGGLTRMYGAMGIKALSHIHKCPWHIKFFSDQYKNLLPK